MVWQIDMIVEVTMEFERVLRKNSWVLWMKPFASEVKVFGWSSMVYGNDIEREPKTKNMKDLISTLERTI
jgi:hypothetical protein